MKGKTMTKDKKKCADLVHEKYQDTLKDYQQAYDYFNEDEDKKNLMKTMKAMKIFLIM